MWLRSGSLQCDTCPTTYTSRGQKGTTATAARSKGWHIYEGLAADGETRLDKHICPPCIGSPRSPLKPAPTHLEPQMPLFSDAA